MPRAGRRPAVSKRLVVEAVRNVPSPGDSFGSGFEVMPSVGIEIYAPGTSSRRCPPRQKLTMTYTVMPTNSATLGTLTIACYPVRSK